MIFLLLEHHFNIFRVAQKHIIHPDELWDAADTLNWVSKAVRDRLETLQTIFRQQRLDLKQHFKTFAHGLVSSIVCSSCLNFVLVRVHE